MGKVQDRNTSLSYNEPRKLNHSWFRDDISADEDFKTGVTLEGQFNFSNQTSPGGSQTGRPQIDKRLFYISLGIFLATTCGLCTTSKSLSRSKKMTKPIELIRSIQDSYVS